VPGNSPDIFACFAIWYVWWWVGAKDHELLHVHDYQTIAYDQSEKYAKSKEGCYKKEFEAMCWKSVADFLFLRNSGSWLTGSLWQKTFLI